EIVWYALAIDYAVAAILLGLVSFGLVGPDSLEGWDLGPFATRSPVFLCTAAFWIFITGMASLLRLTGVIAALMRVYSPVALLLLPWTALWLAPHLSGYDPEHVFKIANASGHSGQGAASRSIIPFITGFFAMAGLLSVDWGASSRKSHDVLAS